MVCVNRQAGRQAAEAENEASNSMNLDLRPLAASRRGRGQQSHGRGRVSCAAPALRTTESCSGCGSPSSAQSRCRKRGRRNIGRGAPHAWSCGRLKPGHRGSRGWLPRAAEHAHHPDANRARWRPGGHSAGRSSSFPSCTSLRLPVILLRSLATWTRCWSGCGHVHARSFSSAPVSDAHAMLT